MSSKIVVTPTFAGELKKLKKKHRSLKKDVQKLAIVLAGNPYLGARLTGNFFKVRMAISSKGQGKSGGARVITHVMAEMREEGDHHIITLLRIYDKSTTSTLSINEIKETFAELSASFEEE